MRIRTILLALPAFSLPVTSSGQSDPAGLLAFTAPGAATRGQLGMSAGQLLCRFDFDDCRGIGAGPAGAAEITGLRAMIQDQNGNTPAVVSLHAYGEQPGLPDFPTQPAAAAPGTTALASVTNIVLGGGGGPSTPIAWTVTVAFTTPLLLPAQDLFLGVEFAAAPTWPLDGEALQIHIATPGTLFAPGPGPIGQGSYVLAHDPARALLGYSAAMQQGIVDPMVQAGRGRGVASALVQAGGTLLRNGSFLGGLHPDAAAPPLNAGRADDLGYAALGASANDLVVYLGDASGAFSASPLPFGSVVPGGQGQFCLAGSAVVLGLRIGSGTGVDEFALRFTPLQRTILRGIDFTSQAIVIRPGGVPIGTPCMRQRL